MVVKIINKSKQQAELRHDPAGGAIDTQSALSESIILKPLERAIIKTGLYIALPMGYEAQIRPRSGLAAKHGITVLNAPGTIDADYRGEIGVILVNLSNDEFTIKDGDRIAQMVIARFEHTKWEEVNVLNETSRGEGGFRSTGI